MDVYLDGYLLLKKKRGTNELEVFEKFNVKLLDIIFKIENFFLLTSLQL